MNCTPLCDYINKRFCGGTLRRFHWTCLKCWTRRYYYGRVDRSQFNKSRKHAIMGYSLDGRKSRMVLMESENKQGIVTPRNYYTYFIMLKYNVSSSRWILKNAVVKVLLSIAETIAQW